MELNLLSRTEIQQKFDEWLKSWNEHDLPGVMEFIHDDVIFNTWSGLTICGKKNLHISWTPWFANHGDFKFVPEDILIDVETQKLTFSWELEWPSPEKKYFGKREVRKGVDILSLKDGKIYSKDTYSKTSLQIDSVKTTMHPL